MASGPSGSERNFGTFFQRPGSAGGTVLEGLNQQPLP
jgi:hypothetical protein